MVLDTQKKKHLVVVAIQKKTTPGPSAKDKKLKMVVEVVPSDDEETFSGLVFKRKHKVDVTNHVPSNSDG